MRKHKHKFTRSVEVWKKDESFIDRLLGHTYPVKIDTCSKCGLRVVII